MPGTTSSFLVIVALLGPASTILAQGNAAAPPRRHSCSPRSVFVEELTWPEIRDAMASGCTSAIVYTGSTEENGPHLALGKHTVIAHYVAAQIAKGLGDALVYPTLPFAPAHDPATRTGLMAFPGTVSLSTATYGAVAHDVLVSALAAGFRNVFIMGDHGLGQDRLRVAAESLDVEWSPKGRRIFYIPDVYYAAADSIEAYLARYKLPTDGHAGIDDTSELLFIEAASATRGRWVRASKLAWADSTQFEITGIAGDPRRATTALGRIFVGFKVEVGMAAIRQKRRVVRRTLTHKATHQAGNSP